MQHVHTYSFPYVVRGFRAVANRAHVHVCSPKRVVFGGQRATKQAAMPPNLLLTTDHAMSVGISRAGAC